MKRFALSMVVGVAFFALFLAGPSHAGGLYVSSFGTPDMGVASAGANAIANDASTAHTNPAGMTRLDDHRILMGLAPGFATVKFDPDEQSPSGTGNGGEQGSFLPISSNSYVHKLSDRWRLGMSLLSFAGAGLDPSNDWAGRFETTKVQLFTLSFAPMAAFRVTDWLSVGGGPLISYGRLDMTVRVREPILADPNVKLKNMEDWAVTGIASVLIEPSPGLRFGVVYQGETDFHLSGDIKLPGGLGFTPALDLEFPLAQAVRSSVYWDATDRIALVMNAGWEDWSVMRSLPVSTTNGSANVPLNFRDTWYIGAGGFYQLNDQWTLQTGFRYDSSALKDRDRTTVLPVDRVWTVGVGGLYDYSEKLKIGLAFSWSNLGSAPVNRASVKGKYSRNDLLLFNVSLNWKKLPWSGRGTF
jgi:long-chain fatty acid transport protein